MLDRRRLIVLAATASLVGAAVPASATAAFRHADRQPIERVSTELDGVDAIAPDDVWAVGTLSSSTPLLRHWDGTSWRSFRAPTGMQRLRDVDHLSSSDVWVAGQGGIIHWDGSAWTMSYDAGSDATYISSVVAISADDVWGVGVNLNRGSIKVHWNGSTWTKVGKPNPNISYVGVDGDRSDNVWVVGQDKVVERWDGHSWRRFAHQPISPHTVAVLSPDDVWIAGDKGPYLAGMLHWDGQHLVPVDVPTPGTDSSLNGLSIVSATDIWAVGRMERSGTRSVIEHWDGSHWHLRPTPPIPRADYLNDVSAATADDAYAVGYVRDHRFTWSSLILHWDGTAWTQMP